MTPDDARPTTAEASAGGTPLPFPPRKRSRGRPRKSERSEVSTREQLLDAAEIAFVERGYEGVTLNEVAARAGYTTGAIYNHFESKAELLVEVVKLALSRLSPAVEQAYAEGGMGASYRMLPLVHLDTLTPGDRLMLAEVHIVATRYPEVASLLAQAIRESVALGVERLHAARTRGELPEHLDARAVAMLFTVFVAGLNHIDTIDPGLIHDDTFRRYLSEWTGRLLDIAPRPDVPKKVARKSSSRRRA
jgi:AcrR family transcriptional regulator